MYKRREFKLLHGDGSDSSSSDSEADGCKQPEASGSGSESDGEPDTLVPRTHGRLARLEDISDKEDEDEDEDAAEQATGPPWKCAICPKVLMLTAEILAQHVLSKAQRHARAQKRQAAGLPDPIYPAKGAFPAGYVNPDESDCETHAERMVRVRDEHTRKTAAAVAIAAAAHSSKGRQRQRNRKKRAPAGGSQAVEDGGGRALPGAPLAAGKRKASAADERRRAKRQAKAAAAA